MTLVSVGRLISIGEFPKEQRGLYDRGSICAVSVGVRHLGRPTRQKAELTASSYRWLPQW